ncbi:MAG: RNA 2',3'-cyclic phosphodiesterase [Chloroflexi bacterium]|jgi:2'-5' RNA ligase|nr:RNA 2',3'-cyclic phosphodiesterase [Chloroflexota bacterium]
MEPLRLFIAIELPLALLQEIDRVVAPLRLRIPGELIRWVPYQNIHLTLKFLGEVSPSNVELICQAMAQEASRHSPFMLTIEGWGVFPELKRPRVLWIGIQAPPELFRLQRGIDAITQRLGYLSEERSFTPHLTIGRVRAQASPEEIALIRSSLQSFSLDFKDSFTVNAIHLIKSDLQPQGARYTRLFTAPLSATEVTSERP